jgi:undecaprenyl-diphosphatase
MTILQAIVLGITQGLTEFAPVSSSGHLILVPWLFGWSILDTPELNKTFDVALHLGTLVGAVAYFRRDLWRYLTSLIRSLARRSVETPDERIAWALVAGTVPGAITGALLEGFITDTLGQPWLIAVMLAVFGVVLYVVDRLAPSRKPFQAISVPDGLVMGVAQALALQPGVSRSGITMTAGRLLAIDRESAARFSFLLSIPIIAGAGLFKGLDVARTGLPPGMAAPFAWGIVSSAISGFIVIAVLLSFLRRRDFLAFAIYRIAVAALVLTLLATGVRT